MHGPSNYLRGIVEARYCEAGHVKGNWLTRRIESWAVRVGPQAEPVPVLKHITVPR